MVPVNQLTVAFLGYFFCKNCKLFLHISTCIHTHTPVPDASPRFTRICERTYSRGRYNWLSRRNVEQFWFLITLDGKERDGGRKGLRVASAGKIIYFIVISKSISIDWKVAKGDVCVHDPSGSKDLLSNGPGGGEEKKNGASDAEREWNR